MHDKRKIVCNDEKRSARWLPAPHLKFYMSGARVSQEYHASICWLTESPAGGFAHHPDAHPWPSRLRKVRVFVYIVSPGFTQGLKERVRERGERGEE